MLKQYFKNLKLKAMAFPVAAAIAAGAQVATSAGNWMSQGKLNKKTRQWNEKMYAQQRADSLADWNMTNEYNSPEATMKRYADAGLNPNLIYGTGSNASGEVRSSSAGSWNPKSPDFSGFADAITSFVDIKAKEATISNLAKQGDLLLQQSANTAAQTAESASRTARNKFDLDLAQDLRDTSVEAAQANLEQVKATTQSTLTRMELDVAKNASDLKEAATRILKMRAEMETNKVERLRILEQIRNLEKDTQLKQADLNLRKNGLGPGDPAWLRILGQAVEGNINMKLPKMDKRLEESLNRKEGWLPGYRDKYESDFDRWYKDRK